MWDPPVASGWIAYIYMFCQRRKQRKDRKTQPNLAWETLGSCLRVSHWQTHWLFGTLCGMKSWNSFFSAKLLESILTPVSQAWTEPPVSVKSSERGQDKPKGLSRTSYAGEEGIGLGLQNPSPKTKSWMHFQDIPLSVSFGVKNEIHPKGRQVVLISRRQSNEKTGRSPLIWKNETIHFVGFLTNLGVTRIACRYVPLNPKKRNTGKNYFELHNWISDLVGRLALQR